MLRKFGIIAVLSLLAVAFAAVPALAVTNFANAPQGAHYVTGFGEPTCTITGTTVNCTGTQIAGVGNTNATVTLAVTSTFTGTCTNRGGNLVEPFTESETVSTSTVVTSTKNGRLIVPAQTATAPGEEEFLANFECPNPNWTADVTTTDVSFLYTLTFAGFNQPAITIRG
jgi:hypothetical protein